MEFKVSKNDGQWTLRMNGNVDTISPDFGAIVRRMENLQVRNGQPLPNTENRTVQA